MKTLLLCLLWVPLSVSAQMHLTPIDNSINLEEVPKGIKIDKPASGAPYLSPKERDVLLNKLFTKEIKSFDDVDRDILYKSIVNYSKEKLQKKYPFITEQKYKQVKDAFK